MLGWFLSDLNHTGEAESLIRQCIAIREKSLNADDWKLANARSHLGRCLAKQAKFAEAEVLLLQGYDDLTKAKDTPPKRVGEALAPIVQLYEAWGRPAEAEAWRQRANKNQMERKQK